MKQAGAAGHPNADKYNRKGESVGSCVSFRKVQFKYGFGPKRGKCQKDLGPCSSKSGLRNPAGCGRAGALVSPLTYCIRTRGSLLLKVSWVILCTPKFGNYCFRDPKVSILREQHKKGRVQSNIYPVTFTFQAWFPVPSTCILVVSSESNTREELEAQRG